MSALWFKFSLSLSLALSLSLYITFTALKNQKEIIKHKNKVEMGSNPLVINYSY